MARKRTKARAQPRADPTSETADKTVDSRPGKPAKPTFSFVRYVSLLGVHIVVLLFATLVLPQREYLLEPPSPNPLVFSSPHNSTDASGPRGTAVQRLAQNPPRTLAFACAGTAVVQTWWAGYLRVWAGLNPRRSKVTDLRNACAALVPAVAAANATIILFGAPLTTYLSQTFLLSLLVTLLAVLPPAYVLGVPTLSTERWFEWIRLFAEINPKTPVERALVFPALGTLVGCWAGAFALPLDWERPWQVWPLPCAFGAVAGHVAGALLALAVSVAS